MDATEERIQKAEGRIKELQFFLHQYPDPEQVNPLVYGSNWHDHLDRINHSKKRIKELKLLIQHWGKDNESRSTSSSNSKHAE
tara:strand:- start:1682 stop:1930 length:249 start_codon:yes stop_codon:yes gene_type:complete